METTALGAELDCEEGCVALVAVIELTPVGLRLLSHLPCSEISLHLSALVLLVSLFLAVPAFTFELASWFFIFLLALAALLGYAFAAFTAFAFVKLCAATAALPFLTAADVHCIDLHCVRVCPRSARPAVVDDLVTQCLVRSQPTGTQIGVLFQSLVCQAPAYNSVRCGFADEIAGLLLILGDVTLEGLRLPRQVCLVVFTTSSLQ